jgi:two-component system response regulator GlrR
MKETPVMKSDGDTSALPPARSSTRVRACTVEVIDGPDVRRRVRVDRSIFVIGTGDGCDLRLTDPTVSREHVRLGLGPQGIIVTDDGSKNGTVIGTLRISRALLMADATLILGGTTLFVRLDVGHTELELSEKTQFGDAVGVSTAIRHVFALLERAAPSDIAILLEGESGVGKDVLARAIHGASPRREGPYVPIDCGAIPAPLIESELFGHERGAFTGADRARTGAFEQANGGTLFLDEIGELPTDLQPKLLRALETRQIRPVGGQPRPVDVRIISATNVRLTEAVHRGEFRTDLFFRLAVMRVAVPPLRDRPEDIVPLAKTFLSRRVADQELAPLLAGLLSAYHFPGNVRELKNIMDRYAVLKPDDPSELFQETKLVAKEAFDTELLDVPFHEARQTLLDRFEHAYLTYALETCSGVVARAIERTGIPRPTMYRMLHRMGINRRGDDD